MRLRQVHGVGAQRMEGGGPIAFVVDEPLHSTAVLAEQLGTQQF